MALTAQFSDTAANAAQAAISALVNTGTLKIYTGTQPANANTAVTVQTLLATLTFSATAFGSPTAGLATANSITSATAVATGTAAWFRVLKSDGTTVVFDGSVGTSGCDLNLNSTAITSGATVAVSSFTCAVSEAGS